MNRYLCFVYLLITGVVMSIGSTVVAQNKDNIPHLLPNGLEHIFTVDDPQVGIPVISAIAFSPDGQYMVGSGTNPGGSGIGVLFLWHMQSRELLRQFRGEYDGFVTFPDLYDVAFSPDSRWLVGNAETGYTFLWDVNTGEVIRRLQGMSGPIAFSPDGELLLTVDDQLNVILSNVQNGPEITRLTGHQAAIRSAVFSPDGKTVITASDDQNIILWDVATGEPQHSMNMDGEITSLAIHPNSTWALIGFGFREGIEVSYQDNLILWDLMEGQAIHNYYGIGPFVWMSSFSPDGRLVTATTEEGTMVWETDSGNILREFNRGESAAFAPDGQHIAVGTGSGTIELWRIAG